MHTKFAAMALCTLIAVSCKSTNRSVLKDAAVVTENGNGALPTIDFFHLADPSAQTNDDSYLCHTQWQLVPNGPEVGTKSTVLGRAKIKKFRDQILSLEQSSDAKVLTEEWSRFLQKITSKEALEFNFTSAPLRNLAMKLANEPDTENLCQPNFAQEQLAYDVAHPKATAPKVCKVIVAAERSYSGDEGSKKFLYKFHQPGGGWSQTTGAGEVDTGNSYGGRRLPGKWLTGTGDRLSIIQFRPSDDYTDSKNHFIPLQCTFESPITYVTFYPRGGAEAYYVANDKLIYLYRDR